MTASSFTARERSAQRTLRAPMSAYREAVWDAVPADAEPEASPRAAPGCSGTWRRASRVLDLGCGDGAFAAELRRGRVRR